jgi:hypothetical protein
MIPATAAPEPEGLRQHAEKDFFLNLRQAVETYAIKFGHFQGSLWFEDGAVLRINIANAESYARLFPPDA